MAAKRPIKKPGKSTPSRQPRATAGLEVENLRLRQSEEGLAGTVRLLSSIIDGVQDVVYRLDSAGRIVFINEAVRRYGYSPEKMIGTSLLDYVHPDDREWARYHINERRTGERATKFVELRLFTPVGIVEMELSQAAVPPEWVFTIQAEGVYEATQLSVVSFLGTQGVARDITERKRVEYALQESEADFRLLYQNAPLAYQSLDENGNLIEVNQAWLDSLGYKREEVLGRSFGDFIHPEEIERFGINFPRFKAIGEISGVEYRMSRKDGSSILVSIHGKIGHDDQGRFKQTHCIIHDITQARQAEAALKESENQYRLLADNAQDVIFTLDMELNYTYVSPSVQRIRGYKPEEVLKQKLSDVLAPSSLDLALQTVAEEMELEKGKQVDRHRTRTLDLELKCKNGSTVWCEVKFSVIRDQNGRPAGILGVSRDITERRQASERMNLLAQMVDAAPSAITVHDFEGNFLYANQRTFDLHGYSREEFMALNLKEIDMPESAALIAPRMQQLQETGEAEFEVTHRRKDGRELPLRVHGKVIDWGSEPAILSVAEDLSGRKLAEQALRESEERFRKVFEAGPLGMALASPDFRFIKVNDELCKMTGYTEEELISLTFADITHPDHIEKDRDAVARLFKGEIPVYRTEKRYIKKGKKEIWGNLTCTIVRDVEGKPLYSLATIEDITERKRAEQALRESEERFRRFSDSAFEGIAIHNGDKIIDANQALAKMYGYEQDELIGMDASKLIAPKSLEQVRINIVNEYERPYEAVGIRKDGSTFIMEINARTFHDRGRRLRVVACRDITERKRAEEALKKSESLYRAISGLVTSLAYSISVEPDGKFKPLWVAGEYRGITGHTLEEVAGGGGWESIVYPEDMPVVKARRASLLAGKADVSEFRVVTKKGEIRWLRDYSLSFWNEDHSRVVQITGAAQNITERKRTEAALRESEEKYRLLFERSNDAIFLVDIKTGRYLDANRAAEKLTGRSMDDLMRLSTSDVSPEGAGECLIKLKDLKEPVDMNEVVYARPDGTTRTALLDAVPLRENVFFGIARDITERKRAEQERLELERRLLHAQKLESLGVMAGGIAHDFNNLLMAVLGNLDLSLQDLSPVSSARPSIEQALQAAKRAADVTRQILAYSGKGYFLVGDMNLSELVNENAHMLRTAISRTVTLRLELEENLPPIAADAGQIQQVVMNLITNASEAIGDQAGAVVISTGVMECTDDYLERSSLEEKPTAGRFVWLEVADTGCGMDEPTRQRLFDPFFTTKFTGRGLGMSAVLGIVRGHKGAILVDSEIGRGTTMRVLFPISETVREGSEQAAEPETSLSVKFGERAASGVILVADDEEVVRKIGVKMLERIGFRTISAADGEQAVALFRNHAEEIVCVILDLTMPRMDGVATFAELRRIRRSIKVILASGYSEQHVAERFNGKGFDGFIQKPFSMQSLQDELERVLGQSE